VILVVFLVTIILLQVIIILRLPTSTKYALIHTYVLKWEPREILSNSITSEYVASWKPETNIMITAIQVWMGNPFGILWEGDVHVTVNNQGDFQTSDQVIVHYQLDKHAESSTPHQQWFQVGTEQSGFPVDTIQTIWVWLLFNNFSNEKTTSGDGEVIIYYFT
jgi:hypothetical protein